MERTQRPDIFGNMDQLDIKDETNQREVMFRAINWCRGVLIQEKRIKYIHEKLENITPGESRAQFAPYSLIDIHFFVISLANVVKWCEILKEVIPNLDASLASFDASNLYITMRNLWAHQPDHLMGNNNHKKTTNEYVIEIEPEAGRIYRVVSVSMSYQFGDKFLAGGRGELGEAAEKTRELHASLLSIFNEKWPGYMDEKNGQHDDFLDCLFNPEI